MKLVRGRLAAVSVRASFGAGMWVGATLGLVAGGILGAVLAWSAGTMLSWQRDLAFTLGVARALLPLGDQVGALRWISGNWYLVIPAAALLVALVAGLIGGLIGALLAAAYNRSPRHATVVVEIPDAAEEAAAAAGGPATRRPGLGGTRRGRAGSVERLPRPAAVVFDLDGTLVDTVGTRIAAWEAVFAEVGISASRSLLEPMIGMDGRRLASEVAAGTGRPIDPSRADEIDRRAGALFDERNSDPRPLPGARAALARLDAAGIPWAIATSSRAEQVAASVAGLGLPREPRVVDGSAVEHAKPAPDLLLLAARQLGARPEDCWYVGDSTWDMRAATAAGMVAIGVVAGAAVERGHLRDAGADIVLDTLVQLGELLPV